MAVWTAREYLHPVRSIMSARRARGASERASRKSSRWHQMARHVLLGGLSPKIASCSWFPPIIFEEYEEESDTLDLSPRYTMD
jgi:hypothetical protein